LEGKAMMRYRVRVKWVDVLGYQGQQTATVPANNARSAIREVKAAIEQQYQIATIRASQARRIA
jgi:hypothetical protein